MKLNHPICIKFNEEDDKILNEILKKLNKSDLNPIGITCFMRYAVRKLCKEVQFEKINRDDIISGRIVF
jgi:hypothetical protein